MAEVMYAMMSDAGLWRRALRLTGELRGYTYSGLRRGERERLWEDLAACLRELHGRGRQLSVYSYCPVCGEGSEGGERLP